MRLCPSRPRNGSTADWREYILAMLRYTDGHWHTASETLTKRGRQALDALVAEGTVKAEFEERRLTGLPDTRFGKVVGWGKTQTCVDVDICWGQQPKT